MINGDHFKWLGFVGKEIGICLEIEYNLPMFEGIMDYPQDYIGHSDTLVNELAILVDKRTNRPVIRKNALEFPIWGREIIDEGAVSQMYDAMRLPVTVAGALMPDAHVGYGVPIGAVVALKNAVSPMMVGVDIACRMKMTIIQGIAPDADVVSEAIFKHSRFGVNSGFEKGDYNDHEILEDKRWRSTELSRALYDNGTIRRQLGSSGGGNHFVDTGNFAFTQGIHPRFDASGPGFWAIMSHSGSRGFGAKTAQAYHKIARKLRKLKPPYSGISWLEFGEDGEAEEYWEQMNLAGDYASANHDCIHKRILVELGIHPLDTVQFENHHNFAWEEYHDIYREGYDVDFNEKVYVHRKGATPAAKGDIGIIPSSMGTTSFLVVGKGEARSLYSASHGAGRVMSRTEGKRLLDWDVQKLVLERAGITILGGAADELPGVYKDLGEVLDAQCDLVEIVGEFEPKVVRMA